MDDWTLEHWNAIARTQPLLSQWAKKAFSFKDQKDLNNWFKEEYEEISRRNHKFHITAVLTYQKFFPYLVERKAINQYILEFRPKTYPLLELATIQDVVHFMATKSIHPRLIMDATYLLRVGLVRELGGVIDPWDLAYILYESLDVNK